MKLVVEQGKSYNWEITAYDIKKDPKPINKANITFQVKDLESGDIILEKKRIYNDDNIDNESAEIAFVGDGMDGKFRIFLDPVDTLDLVPGYYIYLLDVSIEEQPKFKTITDEFLLTASGKPTEVDFEKVDTRPKKDYESDINTDEEDMDDIIQKIEKKYFIPT